MTVDNFAKTKKNRDLQTGESFGETRFRKQIGFYNNLRIYLSTNDENFIINLRKCMLQQVILLNSRDRLLLHKVEDYQSKYVVFALQTSL